MKTIIRKLIGLSLCITLSTVVAGTNEVKIIGVCLPEIEDYHHLGTLEGKVTGSWPVTDELIKTVHPLLIEYIKKIGKEKYYDNLDNFGCHYVGIIVKEKHQILCSFFPSDEKGWKKCKYPIFESQCGGGKSYFHFVYDIKEGQCKGYVFKGP